jgi:hypothetical protein
MARRQKKGAGAGRKRATGPRLKLAPRGKPFQRGNKLGRKFTPGHSIKSPGRPKLPPGYKEAFELMEPESWEAMRDIVNDPGHKDRRQAAEYVINRRRGKPTERTEVTGAGGKPLVPKTPSAVVEALRRLVGQGPAGAQPETAEPKEP